MLRSLALIFALTSSLASSLALADTPPPADPVPTGAEAPFPDTPAPPANAPDVPSPPAPVEPAPVGPTPAAPAVAAGPTPADEQKQFDVYRRDLINLLALRAEADMLVAAAELAFPDTQDKKRPPALKTAALLKRAQKFGPESPLVWWISTFLECPPKAAACTHESAAKLQEIDADNVAAWLPTLHAEKDAARARALIATMAQAHRFDDFWSPSVLAVYNALKILAVPQDVLSQGLNATAARLNFATSVGGGFMPNYQRLGEICTAADAKDTALIGDCLAIAHTLESGGTFRSQAAGFGLENSLLPAGTARDVARARQRAASWQKERFLQLSARFPREEYLAQIYVDHLQEQHNELATVVAFLRSQHVPTDPPPGWQPQDRSGSGEAPRDKLAPVPAH